MKVSTLAGVALLFASASAVVIDGFDEQRPSLKAQNALLSESFSESLSTKNFLGAMIAANAGEVGAGVTDINDVVQAVHKHVKEQKAKEKKLLPVGEGAYQDPKAVKQRTTDKLSHCEDSKWNDCYKDKGDFLDGHSYGNHKPTPVFHRSGAAPTASYVGLALAAVLAMVQ